MRHILRNGAVALGLIAGAALLAVPTSSANAIQQDGYFGGTWAPIGPRDNRHVRRYQRQHGYYPDRYVYGPRYYGPGYYYPRRSYGYYGPRRGLGFGFTYR